jgi:hypothetical protein
MKKMFVLLFLFPAIVNAARLDCGMATIKNLYVQGERQDSGLHQNSVLLTLGNDKSSACSNVTFAMMKNTEPAYGGIVSMTLSAYTTKSKIRVVVNSKNLGSDTYTIEWVNFQ